MSSEKKGTTKITKAHYESLSDKICAGIMKSVLGLTVTAGVLYAGSKYVNFRNYHDGDNIYDDNKLNINDSSIDDISDELSEKMGVHIDYKEDPSLLVFYAVNKNRYLNDDQKNFMYDYYDLIKDNPYLNDEDVYRSLSNLNIVYCKRPESMDERIQGCYCHDTYSIDVYDSDTDLSILRHEGIHAIFSQDYSRSLPDFFSEGTTEILSNEYFSNDPFYEEKYYPYNILEVKMLCDAVGSDKVLEAYTKGDMTLVTKEISKNVGTDKAHRVISVFENVFQYTCGSKELGYSMEEANEAIDSLRTCIECRNISDEEKDICYKSFDYNSSLFNCVFSPDMSDRYFDYLDEYGVDEQAYFSSKLKKDYSSSKIVDFDNREKSLSKYK